MVRAVGGLGACRRRRRRLGGPRSVLVLTRRRFHVLGDVQALGVPHLTPTEGIFLPLRLPDRGVMVGVCEEPRTKDTWGRVEQFDVPAPRTRRRARSGHALGRVSNRRGPQGAHLGIQIYVLLTSRTTTFSLTRTSDVSPTS